MKYVENMKLQYVIPAVLLVIVLIVVVILLVTGGDDGDGGDDGPGSASGFAEGDRSQLPGNRSGPVKEAPTVRSGLLDEARREGRLAVAQARGTIIEPTRVSVRVSAAPKQIVSVNWQLGCFRNRRARVGRGEYRTRAPDTRTIELPMQGAESCIATVGAQLTKLEGEGRIKVAVIAG